MSDKSAEPRSSLARPDRPVIKKPDSPPDRILWAARDLFFKEGFARVSTNRLAKEAAVSKSTIYKYFPNMVDVLRAVTAMEAESFEAGTPRHVDSLEELCEALTGFGINIMRFLNRSDIQQFTQLMLEEARAHPDISKQFFDMAYGRTLRLVSDLVNQGLEKGFVNSGSSADELAEQLVGMWEGVPVMRAHMGVVKHPFTDPEAWAEKCVLALFGD